MNANLLDELMGWLPDELWSEVQQLDGESRLAWHLATAPEEMQLSEADSAGSETATPRPPRRKIVLNNDWALEVLIGAPDLTARIMRAARAESSPEIRVMPRNRIGLWQAAMKACPLELERFLLERSADLLPEIADSDLVWWARKADEIPDELLTAHEVARGLLEAKMRVDYFDRRRGMSVSEPTREDELSSDVARLIAATVAVAQFPSLSRTGIESGAMRRRFHEAVERHPDIWAQTLPWLMQILGSNNVELTEGTMRAAALTPAVRSTLEGVVDDPLNYGIQTLADGLLCLLDGLDRNSAYAFHTNALARLSDRRRPVFPRPLAPPTATWLSDGEVEQGFHDAVHSAADEFGGKFISQRWSEEEGHVGRLMEIIENTLRDHHQLIVADRGDYASPVEVVGKYRTISKTEESSVHADLALVVHIDVHQRLEIVFAEFVQVKKANLSATKTPTTTACTWTIKIDQLTGVLATSPTAAYWLICEDGEVLAVPAKILHAIMTATEKGDQQTFTLHYSDVRHSVVSLAHYLTYLAVGAWTGSADIESVGLAGGQENRTTTARAIFDLTIRWGRELN
ncbi:hypothetical protein [Nocardia noduli]|uniref:hypothetical protein n=1 Tax=Nocardia noduli TaxID=2815722 RepID=UPI001C238E46|nr:hypothetical protein [Nocardia noduli]